MGQNSANSGNLVNHRSVNCGPLKDDVSHMCSADVVVASWSVAREVASSSPFTLMINILVKTFRKNSNASATESSPTIVTHFASNNITSGGTLGKSFKLQTF